MRGATIVMVPRFSASRWAEQIATHKITVAALNATHIKMILAHPRSEFEVGSRLDRIHFSLPLDRQFRESFAERFGGPRLIELYGFTEGLGITFCTPLDGPTRPGSQGLPTPGYSVKLVDDQGLEVPLGQVGEVFVRTDLRYGLAAGYFKEPEQTQAAFRDGWFHTGDTGYLDPDGYFWFVERAKDMIKRSGLNVAPSEVERVLNDLPEIQDSVVVGLPDEMREEAIAAFVVVEEGATFAPESFERRCREVLADYKVPQHWFSVEEFPVNHVGKIDRKALRRLATELTSQVKP
jgi:crotonobetaine/carnitine-CoA ligase